MLDWKELWRDADFRVEGLRPEDSDFRAAIQAKVAHAARNPETLPAELQELMERETVKVMARLWDEVGNKIGRRLLEHVMREMPPTPNPTQSQAPPLPDPLV